MPAGSPLRFNLVVRRLLSGHAGFAAIDPVIFDLLDGVYAPEGNALRAETLLARGDRSGYEALKQATLATHPGLGWWFQILDDGGAFLAGHRFKP